MEKRRFWALPRLCLCLVSCFLWVACAASKDGSITAASADRYLLTAIIPSGDVEGHLMEMLADAGVITDSDTPIINIDIMVRREYIQLRLRVRNNSECRALMSRIKTSAIPIQGLQIESE